MIDYKLHNDCKAISGAEYKKSKIKAPNDWERIKTKSNILTGFRAGVYKKDNNIIIVYRGTDTPIDLINNDINMVQKCIPQQIKDARKFYKEIRQTYPNCKIIFTRHSLGGSNAQVMGSETGCETITFSAYGTGNLYGTRAVYSENITNYGDAKDAVYISNIDNQIGKTIILNTKINDSKYLKKSNNSLDHISLNPHYIENLGDLSKGVEYKKEEFDNTDTPLFKTGVEYFDYDDSVFDLKNRVLYEGEINPLDLDKDSPLYDLYMDQWIDKSPMPTKADVDKRTRIGELIYVEEYTRSDGTKVSGYYRAYPR